MLVRMQPFCIKLTACLHYTCPRLPIVRNTQTLQVPHFITGTSPVIVLFILLLQYWLQFDDMRHSLKSYRMLTLLHSAQSMVTNQPSVLTSSSHLGRKLCNENECCIGARSAIHVIQDNRVDDYYMHQLFQSASNTMLQLSNLYI
jgi:hypothetical protein